MSDKPLTDAELDWLEELSNKSTRGELNPRQRLSLLTLLDDDAELFDTARTVLPRLLAEVRRLRAIEHAARLVRDTTHAGMKPLVNDGPRAMSFRAAADQSATAWGELRIALDNYVAPDLNAEEEP